MQFSIAERSRLPSWNPDFHFLAGYQGSRPEFKLMLRFRPQFIPVDMRAARRPALQPLHPEDALYRSTARPFWPAQRTTVVAHSRPY